MNYWTDVYYTLVNHINQYISFFFMHETDPFKSGWWYCSQIPHHFFPLIEINHQYYYTNVNLLQRQICSDFLKLWQALDRAFVFASVTSGSLQIEVDLVAFWIEGDSSSAYFIGREIMAQCDSYHAMAFPGQLEPGTSQHSGIPMKWTTF